MLEENALLSEENINSVVVFGPRNKRWAVSLMWRSVDDISSWTKSAARREAKNLGCDRYVLLNISAGFGSSKLGHKIGMPSLAAAVAYFVQGSFLGAWELPDGIWYVLAMRDDRVVPTTDRAFASEEAARSLFEKLSSDYMWPILYAPERWNVVNALPDSLELIVYNENVRSESIFPRLQDATLKSTIFYAGAASSVISGMLIVGWQMFGLSDVASSGVDLLEEQRRRIFEEQQMKRQRAQNQSWPDMPWHNKPHGIAVLRMCENIVQNVPIFGPGWVASNVSCNSEDGQSLNIEANYERVVDASSGSMFEWWASNSQDFFVRLADREISVAPTVQINWSASVGSGSLAQAVKTASVTWSIPTGGHFPLMKNESQTYQIRKQFGELFRVIDDYKIDSINMRIEDGEPKNYLNVNGDETSGPLWRRIIVSSENLSNLPTAQFYDWAIDGKNVVVLNSFSWFPQSGSWSVALSIYERIGVPGFQLAGVPN